MLILSGFYEMNRKDPNCGELGRLFALLIVMLSIMKTFPHKCHTIHIMAVLV
jgi:hypothetical protein